jgi:hypothetical protein
MAIGCKVFSYSTNPFDFEIGGRNQNTQLFRSRCAGGGAFFESDSDAFESFVLRSFGCFSAVGVFPPVPTTLKSSAFTAVLGVFTDPKDANAPDPNPKALDAPVVGEARELVGVPAKGFFPPCEELSCLRPRV